MDEPSAFRIGRIRQRRRGLVAMRLDLLDDIVRDGDGDDIRAELSQPLLQARQDLISDDGDDRR